MLTEAQFNAIVEKAERYKYSSFSITEYEECTNAEIIHSTEDMIVLLKKENGRNCIFWACDDPSMIADKVAAVPGRIFITHIPKASIPAFIDAGFSVWAEFVDFFNNELADTPVSVDFNIIEFAKKEELHRIHEISKLCEGQSRGFTSDIEPCFEDWQRDNNIIITRSYGNTASGMDTDDAVTDADDADSGSDSRIGADIAGFCCVSTYPDRAGNLIIWVREIAVDPSYQGRGYGSRLLERAIRYGIEKGAIRGFLHVDALNVNAIKLYNKYNFHARQSGDGEIQMVKDLR